jgi:hypothetical protein
VTAPSGEPIRFATSVVLEAVVGEPEVGAEGFPLSPKPNGELEIEVPEFSTFLKTVGALLFVSAILSVAVATLNAFVPVPFAGELIHAFTESFKAGLAGLVGLLAGRASRAR